jgi:hypothetical protein
MGIFSKQKFKQFTRLGRFTRLWKDNRREGKRQARYFSAGRILEGSNDKDEQTIGGLDHWMDGKLEAACANDPLIQ